MPAFAFMTRPPRYRIALLALLVVLSAGHAANAAADKRAAAPTPSVDTQANTMPEVYPRLRAWQGLPGRFVLPDSARIVLPESNAQALGDVAATFAQDLALIIGRTLPVATGTPAEGDIALTLDRSDAQLGEEGYALSIDGGITISAHGADGVFYGTQTLQQLFQGARSGAGLPRGSARDWPEYVERAQMLDLGRKYFPLDYLKQQIRQMAWMKLNTFHLHLSEWNGFRIKTRAFPGLASPESYSAADLRALQDYAQRYHVEIIPEIDLPGHATHITRFDPSLRFKCPSMDKSIWPGGEHGGWTIDITQTHVRTFVKTLLDEIVPMFDGPRFHIGGDEIGNHDAQAACPELVAYARQRGFRYPGDAFVDFVNMQNAIVRAHGKTTQTWQWWNADGQKTSIAPEKDIVIDVWQGFSPEALAAEGYKVVVTGDELYVSPGLYPVADADRHLKPYALYEKQPYVQRPGVLGYKISRWADFAESKSVVWFDEHARQPLQALAERTWSGPSNATAQAYFERVERIGLPPGHEEK